MNKKIVTFVAVLFALTAVPFAHAYLQASYATQLFTSVNLTTSYSQLFSAASVVKAVKGMTISNSASAPILLATGASSSEVDQLIIPAGASGAPAVYYPLMLSQNSRIAIHASTGTISAGAIQVNLIYN